MNNTVFTHNKDYTFDYAIKTDGVSISTRFILKKFYNKRVPKSKPFLQVTSFPTLKIYPKNKKPI